MAVNFVTQAQRDKLVELYVGYFNRAPEAAGLNFWSAKLLDGINSGKTEAATLTGIANQFYDAGVQYNIFGAAQPVTDFIKVAYANALGRTSVDDPGMAYWTAKLVSGAVSRGEFVQQLIKEANAFKGDATWGWVATYMENRVAVANKFADNSDNITGQAAITAGTSALSVVTPATAQAGQTVAQALAAAEAAGVVGGGSIFTLTTALGEQVNGTAGNDTINAVLSSTLTSSSLNVGDLIDGKGGTDTLKLIVDTAGAVGLPVGLQVSNVENIEITNGAMLNAAIDASAFVGATTIKQIATAKAVEKLAATTTAAFQSITADAAAKIDVKAAADAASVSIALDKVKGDATTNVVSAAVAADAANTTLAAVNVAGNIVQNNTTQAVNAVVNVDEKFSVTFTAAFADTQTLTFDGVTYAADATLAADAVAEAADYVAAYNADGGKTWTAAAVGAVVTFTKAGSQADATIASFGGTGVAKVGSVTVTQQGTTAVAAVAAAAAAALALDVALGKDVQAATVNTAVKTTLTIENAAGSTKNLTSVDASASAGDITYTSADAQVATIKTGAGKDTVTLATALDATTKAASVSTGAGDDTLNVTAGAAAAVTGGTTVVVDAGEGKDIINLTVSANTVYDVKASAGDDTVVITGTVKTTDKIDGGDGVDTVSIAGKTAYVADDYIVLNKVLTNFETLKLTGVAVTNLDAALLAANYTTLDLFAGSTVDNVSTQALIANGNLNAEATGYKSAAENLAAGGTSTIVYAGTLNITDKGLAAAADAIVAHAETVNLTIAGGKANAVAANNATLTGEAKTATVTLSAGTDTKSTATDTIDDTLVASTVTIAQGTAADTLTALTSLTLSGNGKAVVNVGGAAAEFNLVTVNASALNSVNEKGVAVAGLEYTSFNTKAETIKLGAGLDTVTLNASTYGKVDTIEGLNLVLNAGKTAVDTAKSDVLTITGFGDLLAAGKMTTTQTDMDLALKDAAAYAVGGVAVDTVAFQLGGNTYLFSDKGTAGSVDALDIVVKLTGTVDLDALVLALN